MYSGITIFGLAVGLAACLAIELHVQDEYSYDRFHSKAADIYRLTEIQQQADGTHPVAQTPGPLAPSLAAEYPVVGVVKNFHFESLRKNIGALSMVLGNSPGMFAFQLKTDDVLTSVKKAEAIWKRMAPGQPFEYRFMNEDFDATYRAEARVGSIFITFALLSILIGCLGLFGLAAFTAERRTKEIGVRKVLGASVGNIAAMLSKDFLKLVLIAILIASPLAWYGMNAWLGEFAYKIDMQWWMFALAGVLAIAIALLTVSFQSIKAALMNPVKSLRSE